MVYGMERGGERKWEEEGWEAWEKKTFNCWNEGGKKWAYTLANGGGELENPNSIKKTNFIFFFWTGCLLPPVLKNGTFKHNKLYV